MTENEFSAGSYSIFDRARLCRISIFPGRSGVFAVHKKELNRHTLRTKHIISYWSRESLEQMIGIYIIAFTDWKRVADCPDLGWPAKKLCIKTHKEPTAEKIKAEEEAKKAIALIIKEKSRTGIIECPVCKGTLNYSVINNNHIHGQCETDGCLS